MSARSRHPVGAAALAALLVLIPAGWLSHPAHSAEPGQPFNPLSGFSIGGINVGKAIDAAQSAQGALGEVSEPQEIEMGASIAAGLLGAAPLEDNTQEQKYVNNVGLWLALHSGRPDLPWHFAIIETDSINAFATPGGNIFITRGLMRRIHTESELAGVLGHEIAHVVQKHQLADIKKHATKGLVLDLAQLKGGGGLGGDAARAFARVGLEGYVRGLSREDELEADSIGVVIAARGGYEPFGLVSVLQTLQALPADDGSLSLFLKTHPSPTDRLAALEQKLPPWFDTLAKPNPALLRYNDLFKPKA